MLHNVLAQPRDPGSRDLWMAYRSVDTMVEAVRTGKGLGRARVAS